MTADELFQLSIEGKRHELIDGIVVEMEPPGADHGIVSLEIGALLREHARRHGLGRTFGEVGFLLRSNPDWVMAPDAAFVARGRADAVGRPARYWPGAPDLAVEVVSPNDTWSEVEGKAQHWLDGGARAVLIVDPPLRTATVYRPGNAITRYVTGDRVDLSDVVSGWTPALDDLLG
jgi:Uma2 family endonuclease